MYDSNTNGTARGCRSILIGLLLLGACAYQPVQPGPRTPQPRSVADVTAALGGSATQALQDLRRMGDSHPVLLRQAWLLEQSGRPREALRSCNQVLFHRHRPTRSFESLALLIRGKCFIRLHDKRRARQDLSKAQRLALQGGLRRRASQALAGLEPPRKKPANPQPGAGATPRLLPRSAWSSRPAIAARLDPMGGINRLTIHHSADLCRSSSAAVRAHLRILQRYHMERGWGDIGYHYLIDPAGRIWTGREIRYQGAHAKGWRNKHNVGICLLGNFVDKPQGNHPSQAQIASMTRLIRALQATYKIPHSQIKTHQELLASTECPGPRLQRIVDDLRVQLAEQGRSPAAGGVLAARRE